MIRPRTCTWTALLVLITLAAGLGCVAGCGSAPQSTVSTTPPVEMMTAHEMKPVATRR